MTLLDSTISDGSVTNASAEPTDVGDINEVHLVGKMSQPLQMKDLPSGDLLGSWNLVVARPRPPELVADGEAASPPRRRQSHDTIECRTFDLDLIELLSDIPPGARLEVYGALRRRFSRGQPGQSRYGVEVFSVAVLAEPVDLSAPLKPEQA